MQLPANLQAAIATWTSSATQVLVAAPGSGLRFRVWAWGGALEQGGTGDGQASLNYFSGSTITYSAAAVSDEVRSFHIVLPGGLPLPENQNLRFDVNWAGADQSFMGYIYYTRERV